MSASISVGTRRRRTAKRSRLRLAHRADVVLHLVRLELATRHRGSVLGWLWSLGPPLFMLAATYFLFTRVIPLDIPNYPVFLLVGILAWTWFARSLGEGTMSLESRRDLVLRPGFASELLPLTSVLVALVDYVLALPVLFVALAFTTGLHVESLLLPALLAIQLVFTLGLTLALAPLQVFLRDVRQLVAVAVAVGFWLTPVFYRRAQIPDELSFIYDLNPMAHLIFAERQVLIGGDLPGAGVISALGLVAVAALAAGYAIFAATRHSVPEHV